MDPIHNISLSEGPQPVFITLQQAKDHLKITWDNEDALIQGYIEAAISAVESYLGIFLRHRDVVMGVENFAFFTPVFYGPVLDGLFAAIYTNPEGGTQDITDDFRLVHPWGSAPGFQYVGNGVFPSVKDAPDALEFTYKAGIKTTADLNPDILHGIKLVLSDFYEYRTDRKDIVKTRAHSLLRPHRIIA